MTEMRLIEARYVGRCKDRPDGTQTAYAFVNGKWSVSILKSALFSYFGVANLPDEESTLYGTLGIAQTATSEEIKKAYRRMIKMWHPDVSKEPGTREQFVAIQHAYEILNTKRAKYDAGLALQASLAQSAETFNSINSDKFGYRSPLRCGYILAKGEQKSKFIVAEILGWEEITRPDGKTLVSSWIYGHDKPLEEWT